MGEDQSTYLEVEVVGDIQYIQMYPEMYASKYNPFRLSQEVLDNALDEIINGFANTVTVDLAENHIIVMDNGRGIPVHDIIVNNEKKKSIEVICTKLFSGAKFNLNAYQTSIGLHGVGLCTVNALSEYCQISTKDRNDTSKIHTCTFHEAALTNSSVDIMDVPWSTRVEFRSNKKFFFVNKIPENRVIDKLELVKAKFGDKANLYYNNEEVQKLSMSQYARNILSLRDSVPLIETNYHNESIKLDLFLTYDLSGSINPEYTGDVNLHICEGTYLTNITTLFSKCAEEVFKYDGKTLKSYLRLYASIEISDPLFDGHTKFKMVTDISSRIQDLKNNFIKILKSDKYLKSCIHEIIQQKDIKKASKKLSKNKKKTSRVSSDNPLVDCYKIPGETLFIMEGKSADGTLGAIRNPETEAILPVSGKIINVVKQSPEKALNSKKFGYLLEALGIKSLTKKDTNLRFKNVRILCDADSDGLHIAVLASMGIWYYAPQLIHERKVGIILPPLYGLVKGSNFTPIYDVDSLNQVNTSQGQLIRFKGIGQMNPWQLEEIIRRQPRIHFLEPPTDSSIISMVLSDTELKRAICADRKNFNFKKLINSLGGNHG